MSKGITKIDVSIAGIEKDIKYMRQGFEDLKTGLEKNKEADKKELQDFKDEVKRDYISRDQMKAAVGVLIITLFLNLLGAYFISKANNESVSSLSERPIVEVAEYREI